MCVHEVRAEVSPAALPHIQHFYGRLLGLAEWPAEAQVPGGWGAGDARRGVYFQFRHDPRVDAMRRRFTLRVARLRDVERRLREAGVPCRRRRGLSPGEDALLVTDPVGHLLEVRESRRL